MLRNKVRKQEKKTNKNLLECNTKFNEIFKELNELSVRFVKEINQGVDFEGILKNYNTKIESIKIEIPKLKKTLRQFNIF